MRFERLSNRIRLQSAIITNKSFRYMWLLQWDSLEEVVLDIFFISFFFPVQIHHWRCQTCTVLFSSFQQCWRFCCYLPLCSSHILLFSPQLILFFFFGVWQKYWCPARFREGSQPVLPLAPPRFQIHSCSVWFVPLHREQTLRELDGVTQPTQLTQRVTGSAVCHKRLVNAREIVCRLFGANGLHENKPKQTKKENAMRCTMH